MIVELAAATLRVATPLLFASMGGVTSERAGVVNLGLEAYLLAGAFGAAAGTLATGSAVVGCVAGVAAASLVALVHGLICTKTRADHVVTGVALNLLADAATIAVLVSAYHKKGATPPFPPSTKEAISGAAVLGSPLTWIALLAVPLVAWFLARTKAGLRLRAVGENPECAESLGVNAARVRLGAVVAAGAITGLGGAFLALEAGSFSKHMAGGRGYLALAAVVIGKWRPGRVAIAAVAFAFLAALSDHLQLQFQMPDQVTQMLPYVVTLVVLSGLVGRARPPAALGRPLN
ncbi:MAG: ABC transporter permease [Planctomycetes bacterium]|nr:ABC transporter permease [Planctomycetota bacterium]